MVIIVGVLSSVVLVLLAFIGYLLWKKSHGGKPKIVDEESKLISTEGQTVTEPQEDGLDTQSVVSEGVYDADQHQAFYQTSIN